MRFLWVFLLVFAVSIQSVIAQEARPISGPGAFMQPTPMPAPGAAGGPPITWWTGGTVTDGFRGAYLGVVGALNPQRDLWQDGGMLRFEGYLGQYDYDFFQPATFRTQNEDVAVHGASMMFGYRHKMGDASLTGWLGIAYENHHNSDPTATIRGFEAGVRGLLEYYTSLGPHFDFYAQGRYATPFQTWGAFTRLGYKVFDRIWIGPEAILIGNDAPYREGSAGGFVRYDGQGWQLALSGGYRDPLTSGSPTGYYAGLYYSLDMR